MEASYQPSVSPVPLSRGRADYRATSGQPDPPRRGRIAKYALGKDYHKAMERARRVMGRFAPTVPSRHPT